MKNLFIPTHKNNYIPHLLHKKAMLVYIVVILAFQFALSSLGLVNVNAAVGADALLQAHNNERAAAGLPALTLNYTLNDSATRKAQAMLDSNCWSHYCPNGKSPWDFFSEAGYVYIHAGENLAEGFSDTGSVMSAWMNSPTHQANVMSGNFSEVGFGFAYGDFQGNPNNIIIAVHFGAPLYQQQFAGSNQNINGIQPLVTEPEQTPEVKIADPLNGALISSNEFSISGTVKPSDSEVSVMINSQENGRVDASGENYTYNTNLEDGPYDIQSQLLNESGEVLAHSDTVTVTVDTIAPEILRSSLNISNNGNSEILLMLQSSSDTVSLKTNIADTEFDLYYSNYWGLIINKDVFDSLESLVVQAADPAGNISEVSYASEELKSLLEKSESFSSRLNNQIIDTSIPSQFFKKIMNGDPGSILAMAFTIYLIALFAIDFYVLLKSDMLHIIKRKSHLHISTFVILLFLLNIGGITGNILTGLNN